MVPTIKKAKVLVFITCQGQCPRWHNVPPLILEPLCSEVELLFGWLCWASPEAFVASLLSLSPSHMVWIAPVSFWPMLCPVWFCPEAFCTVSSCLAAAAVASLCCAGPWRSSLHCSPGLAGPSVAACSGAAPSCTSCFWVPESTGVLVQLEASTPTSFGPAASSVIVLCSDASFNVSFSLAALSSISECLAVPAMLSFHVATSILLSLSSIGILACLRASSRMACLALIRPHGKGPGGSKKELWA